MQNNVSRNPQPFRLCCPPLSQAARPALHLRRQSCRLRSSLHRNCARHSLTYPLPSSLRSRACAENAFDNAVTDQQRQGRRRPHFQPRVRQTNFAEPDRRLRPSQTPPLQFRSDPHAPWHPAERRTRRGSSALRVQAALQSSGSPVVHRPQLFDDLLHHGALSCGGSPKLPQFRPCRIAHIALAAALGSRLLRRQSAAPARPCGTRTIQ